MRYVAHIYNIAVQVSKHFYLLAIDKLAFKFLAPLSILYRAHKELKCQLVYYYKTNMLIF